MTFCNRIGPISGSRVGAWHSLTRLFMSNNWNMEPQPSPRSLPADPSEGGRKKGFPQMPDYCHAVSIRIPPPELLNMNWPEIPDRQLVELCLEGSEASWAEFLRRFHRLIAGVLAKTVRPWFPVTPDLLEDLHQDVLAKICTNDFRALRELEWRHDGALRGLLQVTAASVAQDHVRRRFAQSRDARLEEQLDELKHDRGINVPALLQLQGNGGRLSPALSSGNKGSREHRSPPQPHCAGTLYSKSMRYEIARSEERRVGK